MGEGRRGGADARARAPAQALQAAHLAARRRASPTSSSCSTEGGPPGCSVADIVAAVTSSAGLDGEAVRDVLVLDRFSFLSVPAGEAERVIEALDGHDVRGQAFSLQRVAGP